MDESSTTKRLVDGEHCDSLPIDDRGLAYGDGVFETVLVAAGQPVWWTEHLARLRHGAARLGIEAPADARWDADAAKLIEANRSPSPSVLKLILTRGSGGRGYSPQTAVMPRRIAQLGPAPVIDSRWRRDGICLRLCDLRLSIQPRLAGIKHLNRLEQVLARAEWNDAEIAEGVLLDIEGNVVCATAANLFIVRDGRVLTPSIENCGVAGVCRAHLLRVTSASVETASVNDMLAADELFVCSSVRGILPVVALGDHRWSIGPVTRHCMALLANTSPAFADHAH